MCKEPVLHPLWRRGCLGARARARAARSKTGLCNVCSFIAPAGSRRALGTSEKSHPNTHGLRIPKEPGGVQCRNPADRQWERGAFCSLETLQKAPAAAGARGSRRAFQPPPVLPLTPCAQDLSVLKNSLSRDFCFFGFTKSVVVVSFPRNIRIRG